MFNVIREDTGSSVGIRKTFNQAVALATQTRIKTGLPFGRVIIARLGTPKRVTKKYIHPSYIRAKRDRDACLRAWSAPSDGAKLWDE